MTLFLHQERRIQLVIYMFMDKVFLLLLKWNLQHSFITFASRCERWWNDTKTFLDEIGNAGSYYCWILSKAYTMILRIEYNISISINSKFWFLHFDFLNIYIIKLFNLNRLEYQHFEVFETFTDFLVVEKSEPFDERFIFCHILSFQKKWTNG